MKARLFQSMGRSQQQPAIRQWSASTPKAHTHQFCKQILWENRKALIGCMLVWKPANESQASHYQQLEAILCHMMHLVYSIDYLS
jgi:hypothetical protein